jgi:hypothetical protein
MKHFNKGGYKMNIDKIKQFLELKDELHDMGVIGVNMYRGRHELQVSAEKMVGSENLEIEHHGDLEYPYYLTGEKDGLSLRSVASEEQMKQHFSHLLESDNDERVS